jgi:molybdopterin synthase sulfur carrier subunit
VRELIEDLERQFPGMRERLCDETGALRRFVNVFVGDEDIRFLEGIETAIEEGAQVSIIPAVAGG